MSKWGVSFEALMIYFKEFDKFEHFHAVAFCREAVA